MCYKEELQRRNGERLQNNLDRECVPEFIQEFFCSIASRAARINYWSTIRNCLEWLISARIIKKNNISDIVPEDLDRIRTAKLIAYFEYMKYDRKILLSTIQTKKNQLGSFWEYLKREHFVKDNIVHNIKSEEFKPAKTNRQKLAKMPTHKEIDAMIEKMNTKKDIFVRTRNPIVVRALLGTGLRESELAGLDLDNLFLNEEYPYILVISKGTYDYSDDGKDIVYLTKDATAALKEWLEFRNTIKDIQDKQAVFLNKNGKRMNEANIKAMFRNYSGGKLTPHMMRHEYATIITTEMDITFASEQLRHKSTNITISTYDSGASRSLGALANL